MGFYTAKLSSFETKDFFARNLANLTCFRSFFVDRLKLNVKNEQPYSNLKVEIIVICKDFKTKSLKTFHINIPRHVKIGLCKDTCVEFFCFCLVLCTQSDEDIYRILDGCEEIWILCSSGKNNLVRRDIVLDTRT